jgi:signal transduction histidine kinase
MVVVMCCYTALFVLIERGFRRGGQNKAMWNGLLCLALLAIITHCAAIGRFEKVQAYSFCIIPLVVSVIGQHVIFWSTTAFILSSCMVLLGPRDISGLFPSFIPYVKDFWLEFFGLASFITFFINVLMIVYLFKVSLERAVITKQRYLAHISHEVRTPLHCIQFNIRQLAEDLPDSEPLQLVLQASSHLVSLTNDVLDLTKMEREDSTDLNSSDFEVCLARVTRADLVTTCRQLIQGVLQGRGNKEEELAFSAGGDGVQIDANVPEVLMLDQGRWMQVVTNFASNALKYGSSFRVHLKVVDQLPRAKVTGGVGAIQGESVLLMEVRDKGQGVANYANLFSSFVTGKKEKGLMGSSSLGLGLAICKLNALRMQGQVGYYPNSPIGSVFFLAVPMHSVPDAAVHSITKIESISSPGKYRILAVDDEPMNLIIVSRMLKRIGYQFDTARSVEEAFAMIEKNNGNY